MPARTGSHSGVLQAGQFGIPAGWIARVRESMARLTPAFSATDAYWSTRKSIICSGRVLAQSQRQWQMCREPARLEASSRRIWSRLRFGSCESRAPKSIIISIFSSSGRNGSWRDPGRTLRQRRNGDEPIRQVMVRGESLVGQNVCCYSASVPATRPAEDLRQDCSFSPRAFVPWRHLTSSGTVMLRIPGCSTR